MMRATLRKLHSPDIEDLRHYVPGDPARFAFLLQLLVGPLDGPGEESFSVVVCTPGWLADNHERSDIVSGRHKLIVFEYDYERLEGFIESTVAAATGTSWEDLAAVLARFALWEFEDFSS